MKQQKVGKWITCLVSCSMLFACQTGMEQVIDMQELNALSPTGQMHTLPRVAEQREGAVDILLPDTYYLYKTPNPFPLSDTIKYPVFRHDIFGECKAVPLGPVPGFQNMQINRVETDDDLFFLWAWALDNDVEKELNGKKYKSSKTACLIFNKKGKCIAKVMPIERYGKKWKATRDVQSMVINRQANEIRLECQCSPGRYAYYYNYKGKFLRREPVIPNEMKYQAISDGWVAGTYYTPDTYVEDLPQLLLYNEPLKEFRRALLKPNKNENNSLRLLRALTAAPDGDVFYAPAHSDTVWQVTPDELIARYVIHGPSVGAPLSPYGMDSTYVPGTYFLSRKGRLCRKRGVLVSNDFIVMTYGMVNTPSWENMDFPVLSLILARNA